ncbi:MAG: hypothetical protein EBX41_10320 [Chitinophagia bacterium]|nr:hypothetical protein [Chitinophagia bacterium]
MKKYLITVTLILATLFVVAKQKKVKQPQKPPVDKSKWVNGLPPADTPHFLPPPPIPQGDFSAIGSPLPPFIGIIPKELIKPGMPTTFSNSDIKGKGNLFMMIFDPTCDHCQNQTKMIAENINLFQQSDIFLLASPVFKDYTADFTRIVNASAYPKIHIGVDSIDFVKKIILYNSLPQLNIYNHERKLIKTISGQIPSIDSIRNYIE